MLLVLERGERGRNASAVLTLGALVLKPRSLAPNRPEVGVAHLTARLRSRPSGLSHPPHPPLADLVCGMHWPASLSALTQQTRLRLETTRPTIRTQSNLAARPRHRAEAITTPAAPTHWAPRHLAAKLLIAHPRRRLEMHLAPLEPCLHPRRRHLEMCPALL